MACRIVAGAAETLRGQASDALQVRESAWAPLAAQLGGWVPLEEEARERDGVKTMTAAKKWMTDHAGDFPQPAAGTHCRTSA